jgi:hypothetical protein
LLVEPARERGHDDGAVDFGKRWRKTNRLAEGNLARFAPRARLERNDVGHSPGDEHGASHQRRATAWPEGHTLVPGERSRPAIERTQHVVHTGHEDPALVGSRTATDQGAHRESPGVMPILRIQAVEILVARAEVQAIGQREHLGEGAREPPDPPIGAGAEVEGQQTSIIVRHVEIVAVDGR